MKFKNKCRPPKKHKSRAPEGSRWAGRLESFHSRRSERGSELGRKTEERVEKLLTKKLGVSGLVSFEYFSPHSPEDCQGKDFRVTRLIDGKKITALFGVTISLLCQQKHQAKHPDVPCIRIPPGMSDERIWQRICRICEEKANN